MPNYWLFSFVLIGLPFSIGAEESTQSSIGYGSVAEAWKSVSNHPSAKVAIQDGWRIVSLQANYKYVLWSFTPDSHRAHPAAVRREVIEINKTVRIDMRVLCEAEKSACDSLVREFEQLNRSISHSVGPSNLESS
jgi:hypothetical protein